MLASIQAQHILGQTKEPTNFGVILLNYICRLRGSQTHDPINDITQAFKRLQHTGGIVAVTVCFRGQAVDEAAQDLCQTLQFAAECESFVVKELGHVVFDSSMLLAVIHVGA